MLILIGEEKSFDYIISVTQFRWLLYLNSKGVYPENVSTITLALQHSYMALIFRFEIICKIQVSAITNIYCQNCELKLYVFNMI